MTDDQAKSSRLRLIEALSDTQALLANYAVKHWPSVLERCRELLEDRDFAGIEGIFGILGGMASFNDVVIHPLNGNPIDPADVNSVNEKFQSLKGQIYDLTVALRRYGNAR